MNKIASSRIAWWMVFLLCSLMVISHLDRAVIALMVEPVKLDLQITDKQIGLLLGAAFAVFFALSTIPAASWVDRKNRKPIIIAGVAIWAFATLGSGLASSFMFLLICRALLAVGEATLTPAASSLIADLFTKEKRIIPAMLFTLSTSIGGITGLVLGGKLLDNLTKNSPLNWPIVGETSAWQGVFILVSIPAFLFLLLFIFTAREPERRKENTKLKDREGAIVYIKSNTVLWTGYFGSIAFFAICVFGLGSWGPEIFQRDYGLTAEAAGAAFGLVALMGGFTAIIIVPLFSQKLRKAGRSDSIASVSIVLGIISFIAMLIAFQQPSIGIYKVLVGITLFCLSGSVANLIVGLQVFVPAKVIGMISAIATLCSAAIGQGIGPTITPYVASLFFGGEAGLSSALAAIIIVCSTIAVMLLLYCRKEVYKEVSAA